MYVLATLPGQRFIRYFYE
uniref:Uncharacterized protein n=1 Tax=Rhizophora mucronata TaxID=61149 RepID=A0A2P2N892_RHIMU